MKVICIESSSVYVTLTTCTLHPYIVFSAFSFCLKCLEFKSSLVVFRKIPLNHRLRRCSGSVYCYELNVVIM